MRLSEPGTKNMQKSVMLGRYKNVGREHDA
jgi:hypothetical protein